MTAAALWLVTAAFWAGCLLPGDWRLAVAGCVAAAAAGVVRAAPARLSVLVAGVALIASGVTGARVMLLSSGPLAELASRGGVGAMEAFVATDARPSDAGAWYLVRVTQVDGMPVGRRALLRVAHTEDAPPLGATVRFSASAQPVEEGGFDDHLRRLHVAAVLTPAGDVAVVRPPPSPLVATNTVRERVRAAAWARLPADQAALLSGLVTGDTLGLSEAAEDHMLASGLTHLVAVSGSNVALVLAGAIGAAATVGLGARGRRRVAVAALVWFAVLVRGEPSVLRATVMALLVLAAQASGRGRDSRHVLGAAALLLLVVDPFLAAQLGFVLSVLATAGVLVAGPVIAQRVPLPKPVATLVGATVGAQLGVAPVLIATEGGLPLGALPANLVAVPAAAAASAVGVVAAVVAQVWVPAGGVIAALARPATATVLWAGTTFADAPALTPGMLISPAAVALAVVVVLQRRRRFAAAGSVALVALVATCGPWARPPAVDQLQVTALSVGQGDALLVEVPAVQPGDAPARMLVDGGPDQQLAATLLRRRGIRYLDAVAVSHPHADHTDGLPAVLSRIPAGALLVGPDPPRDLDGVAASATATEAVAVQRGVPVVRLSAGQQFVLGSAVVQVLSPPADGTLGREPNDNSLVLRVVSPDGALLLTGDAEEGAQRRLLARPDLLRADTIKVPHHGGNTNTTGFFDAVGAHTAVIGVGADNGYGHPHPDVLDALAGATIVRTDTDGTVTVPVSAGASAGSPGP